MVNTPAKLYSLLAIACLSGYGWLAYNRHAGTADVSGGCVIKRVTGLPCPSCGSTHAVEALFNGDVLGSILWNPFGIIIATIMLITPLWLAYDFFSKKTSLFSFYQKVEVFLKQKQVAIPAITLVIANWIWYIYKGV